ncbi:helix-turn-helix domain-containing protein [Muricauda sp. TY007]|uniref:helix-turn-helix domain-containing protein n=1 Tax=Allomuricauda sp. TY007 TaxID=2683200 RepID=UPI0013C02891|nr:helix-turn-helix transcriptional regulator [Muricauda sp. TY007]NDV16215.1 helix-turn-helix domain-containing protein [Muricauda sp. TY007]
MGTAIKVNNKISHVLDIKIEPFDVNKRYTRPHRHNKYLELVYFSKGSGFHYMDQDSYEIKPPIAFIIKKDEVHHWQIDTVPEGYVIIIKDGFLDKTLDKQINDQFRQLENHRAFEVPIDASLNSLFKLASELVKDQAKGSQITVEGILKALLSKILHYAPNKSHSEQNLAFHFKQLLQESPRNDVSHYADLLHTSSQNLNTHCKKEFGKTASQVIAQQIIKEAKRQLTYTNLSISEIAYASNFKDSSHFIKYFKRFEGVTPLQFKKNKVL